MWFAFKLYLWRIEKQRVAFVHFAPNSCDLLSNCIFDVLKNNQFFWSIINWIVVICFQIVSLTYWKTTVNLYILHLYQLWFAFKLYLWRIEKQLLRYVRRIEVSCDLLSNCIFDVLKNNFGILQRGCFNVVICFQIVSLTYWKTTE